ncbi:hypothetical protein BS47DRAFT_1430935 [Hydnum rufescens UP504]|uniref:Uncharacterized protein n=1 Tax=Hydnum rufescens UP504 TaxID=1448309 RepID=A0A9P6AHM7_9AGAM|nr:hypothetical protein BS47DRAFT_1430935 [Hydnum rufescens UP504]
MTEVADSETDSSLHYDSVSTSTSASSLSHPKLVYRAGYAVDEATGLEAYRELKEHARGLRHKLDCLEAVGPEVYNLLDSTSFALGGRGCGPCRPLGGVTPKSLSSEDAHTAAQSCLDLLKKFEITNVEVEFRESIYTQSAGPSLPQTRFQLKTRLSTFAALLLPRLGSIATQATSHAEAAEIYGGKIEGLQERGGGEDNDDVKKATRERKTLRGCWMMRTRQSKPLMSSATKPLEDGGFTEDYAVVELDSSKIAKTFMGNVIDLGTKIPGDDFTRKMCPRRDAATTLNIPVAASSSFKVLSRNTR